MHNTLYSKGCQKITKDPAQQPQRDLFSGRHDEQDVPDDDPGGTYPAGNMGAVSIARRRLVFIHIKESSDADHVFVLRRGHALKIGVQRTLHRYRFQLR